MPWCNSSAAARARHCTRACVRACVRRQQAPRALAACCASSQTHTLTLRLSITLCESILLLRVLSLKKRGGCSCTASRRRRARGAPDRNHPCGPVQACSGPSRPQLKIIYSGSGYCGYSSGTVPLSTHLDFEVVHRGGAVADEWVVHAHGALVEPKERRRRQRQSQAHAQHAERKKNNGTHRSPPCA